MKQTTPRLFLVLSFKTFLSLVTKKAKEVKESLTVTSALHGPRFFLKNNHRPSSVAGQTFDLISNLLKSPPCNEIGP